MNLGEMKALVIDTLGGTDMADPTLRAFINAGQSFLDRLSDFPHGQAKIAFQVDRGQYFLVFPTRARMIHEAWIRDTLLVAGDRLEKRNLIELMALYPKLSLESTYAKPIYYAYSTSIIASLGSPVVDELAMPIDALPVATDDPHDYRGLYIGPAPNATYYVDTLVTAYSKELVADTDASYWTKHYPLTLAKAVIYKVELFLRNMSSASDYLLATKNDVMGINFDSIEDELQDKPNYMGA